MCACALLAPASPAASALRLTGTDCTCNELLGASAGFRRGCARALSQYSYMPHESAPNHTWSTDTLARAAAAAAWKSPPMQATCSGQNTSSQQPCHSTHSPPKPPKPMLVVPAAPEPLPAPAPKPMVVVPCSAGLSSVGCGEEISRTLSSNSSMISHRSATSFSASVVGVAHESANCDARVCTWC